MKKIINKNEKGITLIALVITIIVLLILAGVAISMLSGENGIINKTNSAKTENETATVEEKIKLAVMAALTAGNGKIEGTEAFTALNNGLKQAGYTGDVSSLPATIEIGESKFKINTNSTLEKVEPVKNPYDPNGWERAYTCTGGVWNNTPIEKGNVATGDIVAKLYKTGNKIPQQTIDGITFAESDEYHLVIEGTGEMPFLAKRGDEYGAWKVKIGEFISNISSGTIDLSNPIQAPIEFNIVKVSICEGILNIGDCAFQSCIFLSDVKIADTVTTIGEAAFMSCKSLKSINIPDSVTNFVYGYTFDETGIKNIIIPEGITDIKDAMFRSCKELTTVTIPKSVTKIGNSAFSESTNITDVYYKGTQDEWNNITIESNNEALTNATIHFNS